MLSHIYKTVGNIGMDCIQIFLFVLPVMRSASTADILHYKVCNNIENKVTFDFLRVLIRGYKKRTTQIG